MMTLLELLGPPEIDHVRALAWINRMRNADHAIGTPRSPEAESARAEAVRLVYGRLDSLTVPDVETALRAYEAHVR